ncbi:MAG: hypothetical protein ACOC0C_06270 [Bacteroidota bacterium]
MMGFKSKALIGLSLLLIFYIDGIAQKSNVVAADGVIEYHNRIPLPNATLRLFLDGKEIDKLITGENGEYHFELEYNKEYTLEISKDGLITKRIKYNTTMPPKFKGGWWVGIPINLYEICDNIDATVFEEPVAIVEFNERRKEYQANPDHDNLMRRRIQNFEKQNLACLDNKYDDLLAQADKLFSEKKYEEAKRLYAEADNKRPWEYHAADRLIELEDLIAEAQASEHLYDKLLEQGNNQFKQGNLAAAKNTFRRAAMLKPNELYPKEQLVAIDKKIASEAEKDAPDQYDIIIQQADNAFDDGNTGLAETLYKKAAEIKPRETYPKTRLTAINKQKAREAEEARRHEQEILAKQKAEQQFNEWLTKGEQFLEQEDATNAVTAFEKALELKPDDGYTKSRLQKAGKLLADQQEELQKHNEEYQNKLKLGNSLMVQNKLDEAKQVFQQALAIKPGEAYPQAQINTIDAKMEKIAAQEAQTVAREEAFNNLMARADQSMASGNYIKARSEYNQALAHKAGDDVAMQKLASVNQLIDKQKLQQAALEAKETEYNQWIEKGDQLYAEKKLMEAKNAYQQALALKQAAAYPSEKISQIDQEQELIEQERHAHLESEKKYNNIIAKADERYNNSDYANARELYSMALEVKPDERYPKARVKQIEELLSKIQAGNNAKPQVAAVDEKPALPELNFSDNSELELYLVKVAKQYPPGITHEVYKRKHSTTNRYIIIRDNKANEFREIVYNWGSEHTINGKPCTVLYFRQQTKKRPDEYYKRLEK